MGVKQVRSISHPLTPTSLTATRRSHIISPGASDASQIRSPASASFLRDVALRDLAVHATHAVCVDGRGDVYQWGDGFFGEDRASASEGTPVLTLRGKVRPFHRCIASPHSYFFFSQRAGYHQGAGHGITHLCTFDIWEGICDAGAGGQPISGSGCPDAVERAVVGHGLVVGRGRGSAARRDRARPKVRVGREVSVFPLSTTTPEGRRFFFLLAQNHVHRCRQRSSARADVVWPHFRPSYYQERQYAWPAWISQVRHSRPVVYNRRFAT